MSTSSIHKLSIYNAPIGRYISPVQEKILDSYKLEEGIFTLTLQDEVTKEIYSFPRWESTDELDITVFDYMKRKNLTIDELERQHKKIMKVNQNYDVNLEKTGF